MSEELVAAAVIAKLGEFNAVPYDLDEIPATLPAYYNEVTVTRRFGGLERASMPGATPYRVTVRAVAKTVSNAREMRRRAGLIEGARVTADGLTSTPLRFESAQPIGPDDGWHSGLTSYTFAI